MWCGVVWCGVVWCGVVRHTDVMSSLRRALDVWALQLRSQPLALRRPN